MWDKDKVVKWLEEHPGWLFAIIIVASILITITEIVQAINSFRYM